MIGLKINIPWHYFFFFLLFQGNVCPRAFLFKAVAFLAFNNSKWKNALSNWPICSLRGNFKALPQKDLNVTVGKKRCKLNDRHYAGGGGKGRRVCWMPGSPTLDPCPQPPDSLTSVCFSSLLSLPLFCQRNLIVAGGGMLLPEVWHFFLMYTLRCSRENAPALTDQVWYLNRLFLAARILYSSSELYFPPQMHHLHLHLLCWCGNKAFTSENRSFFPPFDSSLR